MNSPGSTCPDSGIYKCSKCGCERTINKGDPFPPCSDCNKTGVIWIIVRKTKV